MDDMRILITGCSGYLGSKVVKILSGRGGVEIHGIDILSPKDISYYKRFMKGSVADKLAMKVTFDQARPDVAVHLAFVVRTTHDGCLEESVALSGARNFLKGCERLNIPKVVFLSSAAAYGAHEDNVSPLTESSPIRGVEGYGYSRLKAQTDLMAQEFISAHENSSFVILRPCLFIGPGTDNNFFDVLKFPLVPQIRDYSGVRNPSFQFIHEDDMAACVVAAIDKPVRGIFNVAAEGLVPFSELVERVGKKPIVIPNWVIYPLTALLWRLHLVTSPPAQLDFIRYPWVMDASKMRRELYVPVKTSLEAFDEFAAGLA